VRAAAASL